MQSIDPKVMAAISAAIGAYLQEEAAALAALGEPAAAAPPFAQVNLWAITGRQETMAMRRAWQMRLC